MAEIWSVFTWALLGLDFYFLAGTTLSLFTLVVIIRFSDWKDNQCGLPKPLVYAYVIVGILLHSYGAFTFFAYGTRPLTIFSSLAILTFLCFNSVCKVVHCVSCV